MFAVYLIILAWDVPRIIEGRETWGMGVGTNCAEGKQMDVNRSEKIRMLIRLLEPFEEEVRRVLSDEEDNFANRSEASKENRSGSNFEGSAGSSRSCSVCHR